MKIAVYHKILLMNNGAITPELKSFIWEMFSDIGPSDLEYVYRGYISQEAVYSTIELARNSLLRVIDKVPIKHRIFFIIGEGLQNITKHQDLPRERQLLENGLIVISKVSDRIKITTSNIVSNDNVEPLRQRLEHINELSIPELKEMARYVRRSTTLDEESNANIGLIEIAKRSGSKLLFDFKKINDEYSYFYLSIQIETTTIRQPERLKPHKKPFIEEIKKFHEFLNETNVKLIFKGDFSQENILALFEILKREMPESATSIKLHNIMIEMLQNIEKHGDTIHAEGNKPGFFMISNRNGFYFLTSANYVALDKAQLLQDKLNSLNAMDQEEINQLYRRSLLDLEPVTSKKTGLGFIDIRRRTGQKFNFEFIPVDTHDNMTMFIFNVTIKEKTQHNS